MENITTVAELKAAILLLEKKQANEAEALKTQFKTAYESLKPVNLVKNILSDLTSSPDLKGGLLNAVIGMGTGFLTKKAVVGSTHNPIKQLFGTLLQMGVTGVVSKNSEGIKSTVKNLIGHFLSKKNTPENGAKP